MRTLSDDGDIYFEKRVLETVHCMSQARVTKGSF